MERKSLLKLRDITRIQSELRACKAKEIMEEPVAVAAPETELSKILADMRDKNLHEIPVLENDKLVGIASYKTLIQKRNLPIKTKIRSIMLPVLDMDEDSNCIALAESCISTSFREIPISKDRRLLGIVSRKALIEKIAGIKEFGRIRTGSIMTPDPVTITENEDIDKAGKLMRDGGVRVIPVVDPENNISGIIGVKDIARFMWGEKNAQTVGEIVGESYPVDIAVESVMVKEPVTIKATTPITAAAELMLEGGISTLPVLEERKVIGVVTKYDLLSYIASFKESEVLYVQITGLEDESSFVRNSIFNSVRNSIQKLAKIEKPLFFGVRSTYYHKDGRARKYSLQCKLMTERHSYYAKAHDLDVILALKKLLRRLERQVIDRTKD